MKKNTTFFSHHLNARLSVRLLAIALLTLTTNAIAHTIHAPVGRILGTKSGAISLYQGIPYAQPPVGKLRWAAPEPVKPFTHLFKADGSGNECVQKAAYWRPDKPASWKEDCLTLNVYVPNSRRPDMPVIVGFHGGGSVNGSKSDWDPRELAEAGNIIVTVNYRLGAMGYLALNELNTESKNGSSSGNYGDLDKIEALRWVKNNISAFGGNPQRVTIAGQSAGARAVCFLVASPEAKGLFQGAIIESGRDCQSVPNEQAVKTGDKFVEAIGCNDSKDKLACLRSKTPSEVLDAQTKSKFSLTTVSGVPAQPKATLEAFRAGEFNHVPMIVGNTRDETRLFVYAANDMVDQPVDKAQYENEVRTRMGENATATFAAYASDARKSPGLALGSLDADQTYICPASVAIEVLAKWTTVYAYEFSDVTAPISTFTTIPSSFDIGIPHSAELPYIWGEKIVPNRLTKEQEKLAKTMRGFWGSLTSRGGPKGPVIWPVWSESSPQRIIFKAGGKTQIMKESDYRKLHHCGLFTTQAR